MALQPSLWSASHAVVVPELVSALYRLSCGDDEAKANKAYQLVNKVSGAVKNGNSLVSSHIALKARGFDAGFMKAPLMVNYEAAADKMPAIRAAIDEAIEEMKKLEG